MINTISVLKHRFKTADAYRVRKSAYMRICSLMRFRTAYGLCNIPIRDGHVLKRNQYKQMISISHAGRRRRG